MEAGEFSFTLYEADENFVTGNAVQTVKNDVNGKISFEPWSVEEEDIGSHYYVVKENAGTRSRVAYDDTEYRLTVTVKDDGQGGILTETEIVTAEGTAVEEIMFENIYTPEPDDDDEDEPSAPAGGTPKTPQNVKDAASGDDTNLLLPIAMLIAALAGIAVWVYMRKRGKDQ